MKRFEAAPRNSKKLQVIEAIREAHDKVPEFQDGTMSIDEIRKLHQRHRSFARRVYHWMRQEINSMRMHA
eukprot:4837309-Heterocapsa_arctica.AAC.1